MNKRNLSIIIISIICVGILSSLILYFSINHENNRLTLNSLLNKINNKETFNVLVYNNEFDNQKLEEIKDDYSNLYLLNTDEDIYDNYQTWSESEEGQEVFIEYRNSSCRSACGGDFAERYIRRHFTEKDSFFGTNACLAVIVMDDDNCEIKFNKEDGLRIYKYIYFTSLGFDEENTVYEITNGIKEKRASY